MRFLHKRSYLDNFQCFILPITGTWRGHIQVAIKQLKDEQLDTTSEGYAKVRSDFFTEMEVFQKVNHPNLMQVDICN